jgi:hypothetical protein
MNMKDLGQQMIGNIIFSLRRLLCVFAVSETKLCDAAAKAPSSK